MKVYIASDHAGFEVKEKVKKFLDEKGIKYKDLGPFSTDPVDYPDYAKKVARKVVKDKGSRGILVCGTGTGMVIAANKVKGARAVAAYDTYTAEMSRLDNDANVLGLRARLFPFEKTKEIIEVWLKTQFSVKERHKRRVEKIEE
jgi:ribose 5-phosphate isomerase B